VRDLPRPERARARVAWPARTARLASVASLVGALCTVALGCQESGFDERKETARPLKVQHVLGETKVPGQAEQPLTLTVDALDDTLALRVRPARAAVRGRRLPAYLREPAAGVSLMQAVTATDLAALEAVQADLIIGSDGAQGRLYNDLSRIAPTVMTEGGGGQWKLNLRLVGEALGRTNDAEQLLTDHDREAALTRRAIRRASEGGVGGAATPRVAVARLTADGLRFAKRASFAGTVLADAGVTQVGSADKADVVLLSKAPGAKPGTPVDGSFDRVADAVWWGPGGALAARAALADLQRGLTG
jgi:iron complex transport system substrate-binding protein